MKPCHEINCFDQFVSSLFSCFCPVLHSSLPEPLQGIEGTYISHHPEYSPQDDDPLKGIRFVVSFPLGLSDCSTRSFHLIHFTDSSLRDLTERIVPLGTYYTAISSFVESRSHLDFGLVNHALCASIKDMLKVNFSHR
jgi:gamma-tubulin complex component 2